MDIDMLKDILSDYYQKICYSQVQQSDLYNQYQKYIESGIQDHDRYGSIELEITHHANNEAESIQKFYSIIISYLIKSHNIHYVSIIESKNVTFESLAVELYTKNATPHHIDYFNEKCNLCGVNDRDLIQQHACPDNFNRSTAPQCRCQESYKVHKICSLCMVKIVADDKRAPLSSFSGLVDSCSRACPICGLGFCIFEYKAIRCIQNSENQLNDSIGHGNQTFCMSDQFTGGNQDQGCGQLSFLRYDKPIETEFDLGIDTFSHNTTLLMNSLADSQVQVVNGHNQILQFSVESKVRIDQMMNEIQMISEDLSCIKEFLSRKKQKQSSNPQSTPKSPIQRLSSQESIGSQKEQKNRRSKKPFTCGICGYKSRGEDDPNGHYKTTCKLKNMKYDKNSVFEPPTPLIQYE